MYHYILKDGKVKKTKDLMKWAAWMEQAGEDRRIGFNKYKKYYVSTVFLGLDHSFGGKKPVLFETMVFKNRKSTIKVFKKTFKINKSVDIDGLFDRYTTIEDAKIGHKRICNRVKRLEKGL